ncbi:hypothetical protein [Geotalea sp. SG265]|uniref:hypothetical protein n=1 Tax=Geotalea sp. SG265 TaxID=2922867 RepID=UPI001FAFEB88|nr:hypothetical protein [Geotalea sp. SG265]
MSDNSVKELLRQIVENSIWAPASVYDEPATKLTHWAVRRVSADFEAKGDSVHFVGYTGYEGRVCSPLQDYEPGKMVAISRSGRRYELVGPPGHHNDAEWVWGLYLKRSGNPEWEDLTDDHIKSNIKGIPI